MVCQPGRSACSLRRTAVSLNPTLHKRQPHFMKAAYTRRALTCVATVTCICLGLRTAHAADTAIQYNRDVRPILFENCFSCHGPDSASRQAELRLDKREAAVDKKAIVPGNADASEMIRRILSDDADEQMPPPVTKKKLTDAQKKLLVDWVKSGAAYQPHWSLIAPVRPPVPSVAGAGWAHNPIDNFVAAKLESVGLTPAAEADRRTLARRVSLDLIGLPPTPEMVEAFVKDEKPGAYERLVDKLMASPKWGEHRGRYWLDAARYGDTHGIHIDNYREIWSYRDWVIDAINKNMPFDQFTIENLAGDLLPNATLENRLGSGFNRCNITTSEGGAIDEEYQVLYTRDRVETTSKVWMGLTTGCAVCHDHKFDPITQKEFYELSAFFNNTTQKPMDGNIKDTPPIVMVPQKTDAARLEKLEKLVPESKKLTDDRRRDAQAEFQKWLAGAKPQDVAGELPTADLELFAPLDDGATLVHYDLRGQHVEQPLPPTVEWRPGRTGSKAAYLNQGAVLVVPDAGDFESNQQFSYSAWVKLPANDGSGSVLARMNDDDNYRGYDLWVEGRRIGAHIINRWPADALKVVSKDQLPADQWTHVAITYDGTKKAAGVHVYVNGKRQQTNVLSDTLTETIRTTVPFKIGQRNKTSPLAGGTIQDVRVYARQLADNEVASLARSSLSAIVAAPPEKRSPADLDSLYEWWLTSLDDKYQKLSKRRDDLTREQADIQARATSGYVMQEKPEAPVAYILNRGEYDQRKEKVAPGTPAMLPPFPADLPHNRLGLAKWLLRPEHPLTARVTVNRFWSELFGTGLVRSAGDFGVSGELPSHPELLDWLAVEFRESGWNVKKLFKLMVMSATYRQSAVVTKDKLEKDPDNRLLSRGPRFRMDAEMVRDYALSASGLLSEKIGGPSVKPYQPPGVWEAVAMIGSNTRDYKQDTGEALYRRSMYTFWKRAAPPASMDIFNAPTRETCIMARERTNTPLQALVTLNDPQFVEAARNLAQRAIDSSADQDRRLNFLAERLLARPLRPEELAIVRGSLDKFEKHYTAQAEDAKKLVAVGESKAEPKLPTPQLAAWTMVANELMNLDEVLNK
jgi:mono/diheme cytochrome c family protein